MKDTTKTSGTTTPTSEPCFLVLGEHTLRVIGNPEHAPVFVTTWRVECATFDLNHAEEWARNNLGFYGKPFKIEGGIAQREG